MAIIEWNSKLSVGVDEMDRQHQKLVSLLNQYHDAMKSGKADDVMAGILHQLVSYTQTHFTDEEKLMAQHGYPDLAVHKKFHSELMRQVNAFMEKRRSGAMIPGVQVANFLREWLYNHIIGTDKLYGQFIAAGSGAR